MVNTLDIVQSFVPRVGHIVALGRRCRGTVIRNGCISLQQHMGHAIHDIRIRIFSIRMIYANGERTAEFFVLPVQIRRILLLLFIGNGFDHIHSQSYAGTVNDRILQRIRQKIEVVVQTKIVDQIPVALLFGHQIIGCCAFVHSDDLFLYTGHTVQNRNDIYSHIVF